MDFDWNPAKNVSNQRKHDISFEDATAVFDDPNQVEWVSSDPADDEDRYIVVGMMRERIVAVVYTERGAVTWLISARKASPRERRRYERGYH